MPVTRRKAFAYITWGDSLLVFSHPRSPEAGLQVPAGTMEHDETPEEAVMREAMEETGLRSLEMVRFLGEQELDRRPRLDEIHHRFFFHLRCTEPAPDTWRRYEVDPSDWTEGQVFPLFEYFWVPLPDGVPELIVEHDAMLRELLDSLAVLRSPCGVDW